MTQASISSDTAHIVNLTIEYLTGTSGLCTSHNELDLDRLYIAAYGDASLAGNDYFVR